MVTAGPLSRGGLTRALEAATAVPPTLRLDTAVTLSYLTPSVGPLRLSGSLPAYSGWMEREYATRV